MPSDTEDAEKIGWFARRVSLAKAMAGLLGTVAVMATGAVVYGSSFAKRTDVAEVSAIVEETRNVATHADAVSIENQRVQKIVIDAINRVENKVDGLRDKFDDVLRERRSR